jgi:hypothetical protein
LIFALITIDKISGQDSDSIDYKAYSRIIDSFNQECVQKYKKKGTRSILVNNTSKFENVYARIDNEYPKYLQYNCLTCTNRIDSSFVPDVRFLNLILKLDTVNKKTIIFSNKFKLQRYKTQIIDSIEFNSFFKDVKINDGWKRFYDKYPKSLGFMTLSKIAYSNDKKFCAIYIELRYNSLGAEGFVLLIDLNNFKIIKKELLWQS